MTTGVLINLIDSTCVHGSWNFVEFVCAPSININWKLVFRYAEWKHYVVSALVPFPKLGPSSVRLVKSKTDREVPVPGRQHPKKIVSSPLLH